VPSTPETIIRSTSSASRSSGSDAPTRSALRAAHRADNNAMDQPVEPHASAETPEFPAPWETSINPARASPSKRR
jgi:hypothetical protein